MAILSTPVPSDVLLLVSPLTSALAPSQLVFLRLSLGALLLQTRFIFTQRLSGDTLHTVVRSTGITRTQVCGGDGFGYLGVASALTFNGGRVKICKKTAT